MRWSPGLPAPQGSLRWMLRPINREYCSLYVRAGSQSKRSRMRKNKYSSFSHYLLFILRSKERFRVHFLLFVGNILNLWWFLQKNLEDINPLSGATDNPVLDWAALFALGRSILNYLWPLDGQRGSQATYLQAGTGGTRNQDHAHSVIPGRQS